VIVICDGCGHHIDVPTPVPVTSSVLADFIAEHAGHKTDPDRFAEDLNDD
jgi:hypothetical protein